MILKTNVDLKEGPGNIIVILGLCFLLTDRLSFEEAGLFEIGRRKSRGWKNFGRWWKEGWGPWKLDNFNGRHMCIIPNLANTSKHKSFYQKCNIIIVHFFCFFFFVVFFGFFCTKCLYISLGILLYYCMNSYL